MFKSKEQMTSELRENVKGGNNNIEFTHVFTAEETFNKAKLCAVLDFPPGASIGGHSHKPDAEMYFVLEGELTVVENGISKVLKPGDAAFTGGGDTHSVANNGKNNAKMLAIIFE
ncbi:MAG: cupin domain-containing protein [Ruminococcaceae bacterium]|nr:cupin domain-containing protein [Oscillospiraceae bacterium]